MSEPAILAKDRSGFLAPSERMPPSLRVPSEKSIPEHPLKVVDKFPVPFENLIQKPHEPGAPPTCGITSAFRDQVFPVRGTHLSGFQVDGFIARLEQIRVLIKFVHRPGHFGGLPSRFFASHGFFTPDV
jgi:hypothetical protein